MTWKDDRDVLESGRDDGAFDVVGRQCAMSELYEKDLIPGEFGYGSALLQFDFTHKRMDLLKEHGWQIWSTKRRLTNGDQIFELRNYQRGVPHLATWRTADGFIGNGADALLVNIMDTHMNEPLYREPQYGVEASDYDAHVNNYATPGDTGLPQIGRDVFYPLELPTGQNPHRLQLPKSAKARKNAPMAAGLLDYFPDACYDVARLSKIGNDQHNPGEPLHWARGKGGNNRDEIIRHTLESRTIDTDTVLHATKVAWRALAEAQLAIEEYRSKGNIYPPEEK